MLKKDYLQISAVMLKICKKQTAGKKVFTSKTPIVLQSQAMNIKRNMHGLQLQCNHCFGKVIGRTN